MTDESKIGRREALLGVAGVIASVAGCTVASRGGSSSAASPPPMQPVPLPLRPLGRTGRQVAAVSLGGEGALRTTGGSREAVPVILEALRLGVRYCDTAPAYQQSQDYYGEAFREAGAGAREKVVLASKTHMRDRDGSLRLLEASLRKLNTTWLDVWQLHDLREMEELDEIFGRGGAIEAVERAKADGRVRYVGLTGHTDPEVLLEAMRRYRFDSVLCPVNPADPRHRPFVTSVVPAAHAAGMAVVAMKVMAAGRLVASGEATAAECIHYAATLADTCIVGMSSIAEVRENMAAAASFAPLDAAAQRTLEARVSPRARQYDSFKAA